MSISMLSKNSNHYQPVGATPTKDRLEQEALCRKICDQISSDDSGEFGLHVLIELYRSKHEGKDLEKKFGHSSVVKKRILEIMPRIYSYINSNKIVASNIPEIRDDIILKSCDIMTMCSKLDIHL